MTLITNPILPGCYPDPSICRVGDDYYLVTSTFEYLPGLPVFHSRDLAHWQQIGHVIDREGMLRYDGIGSSGGLYAPTIRYDAKSELFYVVCTLVDRDMNKDANAPAGNFIVTAKNPAGPWSDPIWLNKAGIDPSLFFDDDGRIWLHGTRLADPGEWHHQTEVWLQELNRDTLQPFGEEYILWTGALKGAVWAEGPHIYRIDPHNISRAGDSDSDSDSNSNNDSDSGNDADKQDDAYYYLLSAEAGTEFHHAISIARAKTITGPYEGNRGNPVLTHRHLGRHYPVMGVGHADFTQGPDGSWWAVMLAMRLYGGYHYNLGRETFLVPVAWEDGWPVFAPGIGRVPTQVEVPFACPDPKHVGITAVTASLPDFAINCVIPPTDLRWSALRHLPATVGTPNGDSWRLPVRATTLSEPYTPAFLGIRQQHMDCAIRAQFDLNELAPGESAGIAVRQSEKDYATLLVTMPLPETGNNATIQLTHYQGAIPTVIAKRGHKISLNNDRFIELGIDIVGQDYQFGISAPITQLGAKPERREPAPLSLVGTVDGSTLDTAAAGGFLGLWLGIYATSNGSPSHGVITANLACFA